MPTGRRGAGLTTAPRSRRSFLTLGPLVLGTGLTPRLAPARGRPSDTLERSLNVYNTHTGEHLKTVYWQEGHYIPEALNQLDYLLRDHRAHEVLAMDRQLFDLLEALAQKVQARHPFHIMSAYRSAATNARLRQRHKGVSKNSQHIYGKAVDLHLPGRRLSTVRRAALALRRGGVGYYPRGHFLHIDTGPVRSW